MYPPEYHTWHYKDGLSIRYRLESAHLDKERKVWYCIYKAIESFPPGREIIELYLPA